ANRQAATRRLRPKPAKLAVDGPLRDQVPHRLQLGHSPEQISHRLVKDSPNDPAMRVCVTKPFIKLSISRPAADSNAKCNTPYAPAGPGENPTAPCTSALPDFGIR